MVSAVLLLAIILWLGRETGPALSGSVSMPAASLAPAAGDRSRTQLTVAETNHRDQTQLMIQDAVASGRTVDEREYEALPALVLYRPEDDGTPSAKLLPLRGKGSETCVAAIAYFKWVEAERAFVMVAFSKVESQGWTTFPPLTAEQAKEKLTAEERGELESKFFQLEGDRPYFRAKSQRGYTYIDAIDGEVVELGIGEQPSENQPFQLGLNAKGTVEIQKSELPSEELAALQIEITETNAAIEAGLLKLDANLNVVFDNRPPAPDAPPPAE